MIFRRGRAIALGLALGAAILTSGCTRIKDRQGSAYTWAILTDDRIRGSDW